jgi:uncharacterized protein
MKPNKHDIPKSRPATNQRLAVVDALRGFAIVSIMLLHNIEHFDLYFVPKDLPLWMPALDQKIWDTLFFLFGGKSYAIFALLFGLTYYIQSERQAEKGSDFRLRFAWRLLLLLGFGIVNSAFYQGDILSNYALIGFFMLPFVRLTDKQLLGIVVILMLQPVLLYGFFDAIVHPATMLKVPTSWAYFGKMNEYVTGSSLLRTIVGNLTNGKIGVLYWNWENGRVFQTLALFLLGIWLGRKSAFALTDANKGFWKMSLGVAALAYIALFVLRSKTETLGLGVVARGFAQTIATSWVNMAMMWIWVSVFVLLYQTKLVGAWLGFLEPMGRMSLSNYMMQSVIGSSLYYGFGLGLYRFTGSAYAVAIGLGLAILQGLLSTWWMRGHKQGPLETLWHKATWWGAKG